VHGVSPHEDLGSSAYATAPFTINYLKESANPEQASAKSVKWFAADVPNHFSLYALDLREISILTGGMSMEFRRSTQQLL
jgi:hypothetical protein